MAELVFYRLPPLLPTFTATDDRMFGGSEVWEGYEIWVLRTDAAWAAWEARSEAAWAAGVSGVAFELFWCP